MIFDLQTFFFLYMTEDPDAGEDTFKVFSVIQEVYLRSRLNTTFLIDTTLLIEFTSVVSPIENYLYRTTIFIVRSETAHGTWSTPRFQPSLLDSASNHSRRMKS